MKILKTVKIANAAIAIPKIKAPKKIAIKKITGKNNANATLYLIGIRGLPITLNFPVFTNIKRPISKKA